MCPRHSGGFWAVYSPAPHLLLLNMSGSKLFRINSAGAKKVISRGPIEVDITHHTNQESRFREARWGGAAHVDSIRSDFGSIRIYHPSVSRTTIGVLIDFAGLDPLPTRTVSDPLTACLTFARVRPVESPDPAPPIKPEVRPSGLTRKSPDLVYSPPPAVTHYARTHLRLSLKRLPETSKLNPKGVMERTGRIKPPSTQRGHTHSAHHTRRMPSRSHLPTTTRG